MRIHILGGDWQFKKSTAMFLPPVVVDINDIAVAGSIGDIAIPTRMAPVLIVIALITSELVLQISRRPKERLIQ